MATTEFTQYEIVKGDKGWDINYDGQSYGTGLSREEAETRVWRLQRIGEAYNLLSEVTQESEGDTEFYNLAFVTEEFVWDLHCITQGDSLDDLAGKSPMRALLMGTDGQRPGRRRGAH